nr:hypothetical protein [Clostridium botulinum]
MTKSCGISIKIDEQDYENVKKNNRKQGNKY